MSNLGLAIAALDRGIRYLNIVIVLCAIEMVTWAAALACIVFAGKWASLSCIVAAMALKLSVAVFERKAERARLEARRFEDAHTSNS